MPYQLGAQTLDALAACLMLALLTLIVLVVMSTASGIGDGMRRAAPPSPTPPPPETEKDDDAGNGKETRRTAYVDREDPADWWKPDDWTPDPEDQA